MFFELEDIRRRRMPTWTLNNTTGWHTAVDSTPSWNYQRGILALKLRYHGRSSHRLFPAVSLPFYQPLKDHG